MSRSETKLVIGWKAISLWMLGSVAILSSILRVTTTINSLATGEPPAEPTDISYIKHPWLTGLHVIPGMIFLLLGPLQFVPSIRTRHPEMHRLSGRVFVVCGLVAAVTAIAINTVFPPIGGPVKNFAIVFFSIAMFAALIIAFRAALKKDFATHRAWMIRAFAIGLALSTVRLFFIPAYLMYGLPSDFTAGLVTMTGFLLNSFVAELVLWRGRRKNPVFDRNR